MSDLVLSLTDLCIRTPDRVLVDGVSFDVHQGKVTAVIGHSGSGKSLSARAAMGVFDDGLDLERGSLRFPGFSQDRDWFVGVHKTGRPPQRKLLSATAALRGGYLTYSPQSASSALNPGRTIGRQLEMAILRREKRCEDIGAAVRDVLEEVGLPARASAALPRELSGGMAQRAALAIAIAPQPRIMIADEPETGLDPVLRRVVTELMLEVAKRHGCGLMLISHNMETVDRVADVVVKLHPGKPSTMISVGAVS